MNNWIIWGGLLSLVGLTLFSMLNTALRLPSRLRIAEQFDRGGRSADFEAFVAGRSQYMLATAILRSVTFLLVILVVLFALTDSERVDSSRFHAGVWVTALVLVLVFGVAIPNAWAKYAGEAMIVRLLPLLSAVRFLCYPVIIVLNVFDPVVRRMAGANVRNARSYADELEQEILNAVSEGERHGAVDEEEKEMIESVIELGETRVSEVMTPRTEIAAVPVEADLDAVLAAIRDRGHSRIPVYEGTIDTILGVLYAKDLLHRQQPSFDIQKAMRKVLFVPETKLVRGLLREFQDQKLHIAVVLDEYGGTAGLVTIEDILEELVGEIRDEYDPTAPVELKRIDDHTVEVDARMRIDDLNDQLDIELPEDEDYETIGGFVFSKLGKIPRVGENCDHDHIAIQVIGAEPRRITRLRLNIQTSDANRVST